MLISAACQQLPVPGGGDWLENEGLPPASLQLSAPCDLVDRIDTAEAILIDRGVINVSCAPSDNLLFFVDYVDEARGSGLRKEAEARLVTEQGTLPMKTFGLFCAETIEVAGWSERPPANAYDLSQIEITCETPAG